MMSESQETILSGRLPPMERVLAYLLFLFFAGILTGKSGKSGKVGKVEDRLRLLGKVGKVGKSESRKVGDRLRLLEGWELGTIPTWMAEDVHPPPEILDTRAILKGGTAKGETAETGLTLYEGRKNTKQTQFLATLLQSMSYG